MLCTPIDWILSGIIFNWTSPDRFYLTTFHQAAYIPFPTWNLGGGRRLPAPGKHKESAWHGGSKAELEEAIKRVVVRLQDLSLLSNYVKMVALRVAEINNMRRKEELVYGKLLLESHWTRDQRLTELAWLQEEIKQHPSSSTSRDINNRIQMLRNELSRGEAPDALLRAWRNNTLKLLKVPSASI